MNLVFDVRGLAHWLHTRKSTQRIYSLLHLSARCMRALIMLCDEQRPASKPQQSAIYICWRMKMAGHIVCHNKNIRVLSWAQWTPLWHAHHTPPALQMRCSFHIDFYYLPLISDATHYKRHTAIYVQLIRNKNRFAVFSSNEHIECIAIDLNGWVWKCKSIGNYYSKTILVSKDCWLLALIGLIWLKLLMSIGMLFADGLIHSLCAIGTAKHCWTIDIITNHEYWCIVFWIYVHENLCCYRFRA